MKEKRAKNETGINFTIFQGGEGNKTIHVSPDIKKNAGLENYMGNEVVGSLYSAISGSGCEDYSRFFIAEAMGALMSVSNDHKASITNAFHGAMLGMDPKDQIESQPCARLPQF